MFDFAEINELCEKYYISERGIFNAVLVVLKRQYPHKNIHFFDVDRQLICHIANGNFKYFKPSNRDFVSIKRNLVVELRRHKARLLKEKPQILKRAFLERLGSKYIRASVTEIEGEIVRFSLLKAGIVVGNFKINVPIFKFFDDDRIAIGHNFLLEITGVSVEGISFVLECTRKSNGIVKREVSEVMDIAKKQILKDERARAVFSDKDFHYRVAGVNITRKEVRLEASSKGNGAVIAIVSRILRARLGFELKWRIK